MKIVDIFAPYLFAFHSEDESENELKKVFNFWFSTTELNDFLKNNQADWPKGKNLNQLREDIQENAEKFEDLLRQLSKNNNPQLDQLFASLDNSEYKTIVLSKRKGKSSKKENHLRLYALKIDANCYVITGGTIKFTQFMEDREHTLNELKKLETFRNYLRLHGVVDEDSFFDLILEQNDK